MNEDIEQQSLLLNFGESITKISDLKRKREPLIAKVSLDKFTDEANKNFDFDFDGINRFYPFELPRIMQDLDFNILCIVGASGSGKSVFSKYFGEEEKIEWDNSKAIISNFDDVDEAIEKLNSVGLNSIPTWCKPRNVLSVGEGFRADLARRIKDNCVIDEYTSVVDRNVALSCSNSIQKYIRKKNLKRCVFVSCHKDFIDTLRPDYVIDLDDECVYDTRRLPKRKFELQIYETTAKRDVWKLFRQHHYLSAELNIASKLYITYLNEDIIGMIAILPLPSGTISDAFRVHRLVILPDYQGLGVATKFLKYIANLHSKQNKNFYIRTSHIKLYKYFKRHNDEWLETSSSGKKSSPNSKLTNWKVDERTPFAFKYIAEYDASLDANDVYLYEEKEEINNNIEQFSLF